MYTVSGFELAAGRKGRTLQTGSVESLQKSYGQIHVSIVLIACLSWVVEQRTWNLPNCDIVMSDSQESPAAFASPPSTYEAL